MAITDKKKGVWGLDQVYNKKMQGSIWQLTHGSPLLFAWGRNNESNSNGDLGLNDGTNRSSPTQLPGTNWRQVAMADDGSRIATKTDGTLWAWGDGSKGQAGQNTGIKYSSPVQIPGTGWLLSSARRLVNMAIKQL